jgi:hypothetical protein
MSAVPLFVVKHYTGDERPILKGNGFDGLELGADREEAEAFVAWVNDKLRELNERRVYMDPPR